MYQINQSFTRMEPQIDFSNVMLNQSNQGSGVLGHPPEHLLPIHCPALINAWHERLLQALANPTQVETRKGHRRVQVLGSAIFDFDEYARVHAWHWTFNEIDLPELTQFADHTVAAADVPYRAFWMDSYRLGALRCLQANHPGKSRLCQDFVDWANDALIRLCWTEEVQTRVRAKITEVLALDIQVLAVAKKLRLVQPIRLADYNHALARQLILAREAPQLIPLYALLAEHMPFGDGASADMKVFLHQRGLGAAVWRLLCRVGTQWINEFLPYFDQKRQSLADCAIEILQMATFFGTQGLPPSEMLHALIQLGGNPNGPSVNFVKRVDDQMALCKRLGVLMARADATTMDEIKAQAMTIFQWGGDHAESVPDTVMRRLTLSGILRRVQAQNLLDQKRHESGPAWSVPYRLTFDDANISAVILNSALAVWQEGQLMRHCADKFVNFCAKGDLLMVSLRHAEHRHPLATVSFQMNRERVQVHKFSGFANRRITDETYELIQDCCRQLQRQRLRGDRPELAERQLMAA